MRDDLVPRGLRPVSGPSSATARPQPQFPLLKNDGPGGPTESLPAPQP